MAGLIFLVEVGLRLSWLPWTSYSDSCDYSFTIHARLVCFESLRDVASVRERWRFTREEKLLEMVVCTPSESSVRPNPAGAAVAARLLDLSWSTLVDWLLLQTSLPSNAEPKMSVLGWFSRSLNDCWNPRNGACFSEETGDTRQPCISRRPGPLFVDLRQ
jgi:hypothetical protein